MCLSSEPCQCSAEETVLFYWLCKSSCFQVWDCLNQNNSKLYWFIRIQQRYESVRNTWDLRHCVLPLGTSSTESSPRGVLAATHWWPGAAAPSLPPTSTVFPIPPTGTPTLGISIILRRAWKEGLLHSDTARCYEKITTQSRKTPWIECNPHQVSPCPWKCLLSEIVVEKRQPHPFKAQTLGLGTRCPPLLLHLVGSSSRYGNQINSLLHQHFWLSQPPRPYLSYRSETSLIFFVKNQTKPFSIRYILKAQPSTSLSKFFEYCIW